MRLLCYSSFISLSQQLQLSIYIMLSSSKLKWFSAFRGREKKKSVHSGSVREQFHVSRKMELKLVLGPLESFRSHKGAFKPSIQVKL